MYSYVHMCIRTCRQLHTCAYIFGLLTYKIVWNNTYMLGSYQWLRHSPPCLAKVKPIYVIQHYKYKYLTDIYLYWRVTTGWLCVLDMNAEKSQMGWNMTIWWIRCPLWVCRGVHMWSLWSTGSTSFRSPTQTLCRCLVYHGMGVLLQCDRSHRFIIQH